MGFKPRPTPSRVINPGNPRRGFVENTSKVSSPEFVKRKSASKNTESTTKKSNPFWSLNDVEDGRPKSFSSVRSSRSSNTVPPSPLPGQQPKKKLSVPSTPPVEKSNPFWSLSETEDKRPKSFISVRSSMSNTVPPSPLPKQQSKKKLSMPTTPVNSTKKTQFRHKVFQNGLLLYEWEQNPKFVTIYYPTPNVDFKIFCNITSGHVQLGTKPENLPTKWFLSHDTGGEVNPTLSYWKQCTQHCRIILAKDNKGSTWARALKDDRVDETTTIKKARPKVNRAQSEPVLSPDSKPEKEVSPPIRSSVSSNDEDSDSGKPSRRHQSGSSRDILRGKSLDRDVDEEEDIAENRRSHRSLGSKDGFSSSRDGEDEEQDERIRRASSQDGPKVRRKSESRSKERPGLKKKAIPPMKSKSTTEVPISTIFVDKEQSNQDGVRVRPRSENFSKDQPGLKKTNTLPRKAKSTTEIPILSTIFVDKEQSNQDDVSTIFLDEQSKQDDFRVHRRSENFSKDQPGLKKKNTPSRKAKSTTEIPILSTIFAGKDQSNQDSAGARRRSLSQLKLPKWLSKKDIAPPRRKSSNDAPISTIVVQKEPIIAPMQRRPSRAGRLSSRSFASIDEELPLDTIEVDLNSDLVSVLGFTR